MPVLENEIKKEVTELFETLSWKKICLLILSIVPERKLVSKIFIYNKLIEWKLLDPKDKVRDLESISNALSHLYQEKLIKKEDWSQFEQEKFERYCHKFSFGVIVKTPKKDRTQIVFRLPTERETRQIAKMIKYFGAVKKANGPIRAVQT